MYIQEAIWHVCTEDCLTRVYRRLLCVYTGGYLARVYKILSYACIQETVLHVYTRDCLTSVNRRLSYTCIQETDCLTSVYRRLSGTCIQEIDTCIQETECITHVYRRQAILHVYTED
jgi:hypothetical protein